LNAGRGFGSSARLPQADGDGEQAPLEPQLEPQFGAESDKHNSTHNTSLENMSKTMNHREKQQIIIGNLGAT
jgi:hypothetical protein